MADAKLEFVRGRSEFRGEGSEGWPSEQLDKVLSTFLQANEGDDGITDTMPLQRSPDQPEEEGSREKKTVPLATFLKEKNATVNQRRKFLAAAVWLHDQRGQKRVTTGNVSKALADNSQSRLGNASQNLIDNVKLGFAEKEGKAFYITDEGRAELDR